MVNDEIGLLKVFKIKPFSPFFGIDRVIALLYEMFVIAISLKPKKIETLTFLSKSTVH